jgi:hypothetical protein
MNTKATIAVLAAVLFAAPLSAQIRPRTDQGRRLPDGSVVRSDGSVIRADGSVVRSDGTVIRTSDGSVTRSGRNRIPPGQLPPKGMCRVWIDGVPPGQQPPVTDCATAERNRVANSRVIYGDRESFPGRGKGKVKKNSNDTRACAFRDAVVVGDRIVNVCRDANGNVINDRNRGARGDDDDNNNRDDRFDRQDGSGKSKKLKAHKNGKNGKSGRDD